MSNHEADRAAELANGFIAATQQRDLTAMRALFDASALFWTNITLTDSDLESRFARIAMEFELFGEFGFVEPRIDAWSSGFLIRTAARGTLPDGDAFEFPVCMVGEVRAGHIVRFEEYLDAQPVAPILAKLAGMAAH